MKSPILLCRNISGARTSAPLQIEPDGRFAVTDLIEQTLTPGDLKAPPFAICYMRRLANGDYRAEPVEWGEWVPLKDEWLGALGIKISRKTVFRLWNNGYLDLRKVSPHIMELRLASLVEHLRNVQDDPGFWDRQADDGSVETRREAYLKKASW